MRIELDDLSSIEQAFAQFCFHAQNRTVLSKIVDFKHNYNSIKRILYNFNPQILLDIYNGNSNDSLQQLAKAIQLCTIGNKKTQNKSNNNDVGKLIKSYAKSILQGASYFNQFKSKKEVICDLKQHYNNNNAKDLIAYFISKIPTGIGIALACDFLKEFDTAFDLPKPDTHLLNVLSLYYGEERARSYNDGYIFIEDFIALVKEIRQGLSDNSITVYKLDRMIWLCCTGEFFLDNKKLNAKLLYTNIIK